MKSLEKRSEKGGTITYLMRWFTSWICLNGGDSSNSKGGSKYLEASSSSSSRKYNLSEAEARKEAFFNLGLGVGFGLIYFVRDELKKMVELRQNIELLLQELRDQDAKSPSKSKISCLPTETVENDRGEWVVTRFSSSRYRRERSLRMDQLEAELEAEFDRLKITSDSFKYSTLQYSEVNVEDSAPESSLIVCHEEDECGPHEEFYGVSPRELERKLHEVLETRQKERIDELESCLEYAMQQLERRGIEYVRRQEAVRLDHDSDGAGI